MRKKLSAEEKRSVIIGVKVKPDTKKILKYLAQIEDEQLSTYIDRILTTHIKAVLGNKKWEDIPLDERGDI